MDCRRQALLGYFGERDRPPCGNCDNCRDPPESWDGTVAAQKALSAAYRTGERFGAHHLADVLVGNRTERVARFGHDRIKTFGAGTELDARAWLSVIRQLVAQSHLLPDPEGHGGLQLGAERPPGIARRDPDPLPHRDDSASGAANPPPAENRPKNPPRPSTRKPTRYGRPCAPGAWRKPAISKSRPT